MKCSTCEGTLLYPTPREEETGECMGCRNNFPGQKATDKNIRTTPKESLEAQE